MKFLLFVGLTFFTISSHSQVLFDRPVALGPSDVCYEASNQEQVIYCIPQSLCRLDSPKYSKIDGIWQAQFSVGVCPDEHRRLKVRVTQKDIKLEVRYYRAVSATIDSSRFDQISSRYRPSLTSLGDNMNFYGPTLYSFSLLTIRPFIRDYTLNYLKDLLENDTQQYLGSIHYRFLGVVNGKTSEFESSVPIYSKSDERETTL